MTYTSSVHPPYVFTHQMALVYYGPICHKSNYSTTWIANTVPWQLIFQRPLWVSLAPIELLNQQERNNPPECNSSIEEPVEPPLFNMSLVLCPVLYCKISPWQETPTSLGLGLSQSGKVHFTNCCTLYPGKPVGETILYSGCRHKKEDFIYEEELTKYLEEGTLSKLHMAFSRDQPQKIYVQHLMAENEQEIHQILETGGHIYVCG